MRMDNAANPGNARKIAMTAPRPSRDLWLFPLAPRYPWPSPRPPGSSLWLFLLALPSNLENKKMPNRQTGHKELSTITSVGKHAQHGVSRHCLTKDYHDNAVSIRDGAIYTITKARKPVTQATSYTGNQLHRQAKAIKDKR